MKFDGFKKWILLLGVFAVILTVWLGGCATSPSERPDREKIKQDAEKGMQDLQREEDRNGNPDGY